MAGTLYLVATPIGNLEDITMRALRILTEVDLIAAEDTRVTRKLLNHFEIKRPLISYYEHNKMLREEALLGELQGGKNVALVSDAGTPCLSDPGSDLVRAAIARGIQVVPVPGASALLTALVASGLDRGTFCFEGFLPREKAARRKRLRELSADMRTLVFYEAPHRLRATLADLCDIFGAARQAAACRELTKRYEEYCRGSLEELGDHFTENEPRGEFVLVVAGAEDQKEEAVLTEEIQREFLSLLETGSPRKQAAKELAAKYGLKAKALYEIGLKD